MVHGREHNGETFEFGVSGYVYNNVFLLFDRPTRSLWYPLDDTQWTAVGGPRLGDVIPFIEEPRVMPLGEWLEQHPNSTVLLGDKRAFPDG